MAEQFEMAEEQQLDEVAGKRPQIPEAPMPD